MAEIKCPLREAAQVSGKELALVQGEYEVLYSELDMMVTSTAARLSTLGCTPGERVALFMNTEWRMVVLILALNRIGVLVCPLSTRLPAEGLRQRMLDLNANRLFARVQGPGLEKLADFEVINPDDIVAETVVSEVPVEEIRFDLAQPSTILYTSGSTSEPKGVLHTIGNHYYSARGSNIAVRLRSRDRWLLSLPVYHVAGMAILQRCILNGATIVIPEGGETWLAAAARYKVTHLSLVPAQLLEAIQDVANAGWSESVKSILLGGEATRPNLLRRARDRKLPIVLTYGLTETAAQVTGVLPETPPEFRDTSGAVLKHRELRLAEDGEILVRGQTLFKGYVESDELTLPLDEDGWFHTGDLGRMSGDYLSVTGRKDNMFISGGENIQPEEIEEALCAIEDVERAVVVPVPHEKFGQRPVAFVKTLTGASSFDQLACILEEHLPRFKVPDRFFDWPDSEAAATKVDRAHFRQLAEMAAGD
ncbi:MAG: o-succinylbenzoate--CoA ligase [Verrucomicrobiota bacterium]